MTKRTVPAMLLLAFSGTASAAAFQLWEQNASGIATAYAGSAAVADAEAMAISAAGRIRRLRVCMAARTTEGGMRGVYHSRRPGTERQPCQRALHVVE